MATCRTCENPQVERINLLIGAGAPIRQVARMFEIPRSSLARHAAHVMPLARRLGVLPDPPIDLARLDPLEEALELARRANTERERLKSLEQIRGATALKLRSVKGQPDEETLDLLDRNVFQAEEAYRTGSGGFEATVRALQGLREAIRQRIDAVKAPQDIEAPMIVLHFTVPGEDDPPTDADRHSHWAMTLDEYFRGVPIQYHDAGRYVVKRRIPLTFHGTEPLPQEVKVYEIDGGLVWTKGEPA